MASLRQTVDHLRHIARPARADHVTDPNLLARFAASRDEAAFTELVRHHGSLVIGVRRQVVGPDSVADDAFEATFLLLACKAGRAGWHKSVAGWLHKTARLGSGTQIPASRSAN